MDYKYIEQLIDRYFLCETTREEEQILRSFFCQDDIPEYLRQYKSLFLYQQAQGQTGLGKDFDERILSIIEQPVVKAKRITLMSRFSPFFKAAAALAVVLSISTFVQHYFFTDAETLDYNYEAYQDTYDDPQAAYKHISSALMMVSEGINKSQTKNAVDSLVHGADSSHTITE